jgi:hypothetical protein
MEQDISQVFTIAAATTHEANRKYCALHGDSSQLSWEDAPKWQKDSCYVGIELAYRNWRDRAPLSEKTFEESHNRWMAHKQREGWTYGPVKDVESHEHPCMVPYGMLPVEQRQKDEIFNRVAYAVFTTLLGE